MLFIRTQKLVHTCVLVHMWLSVVTKPQAGREMNAISINPMSVLVATGRDMALTRITHTIYVFEYCLQAKENAGYNVT